MKKALIVETNKKVINHLKKLLTNLGFDAKDLENGEEALELIKKEKYDLLITEVVIPKMDGFNLSQNVKRHSDNTKIFIISGVYKGASFRQKALSNFKADEFIEKPFSHDDIKKLLKKHFNIKTEKEEKSQDASNEIEEENLIGADELFGDILEEVSKEIKKEEKKQPKASADSTQKFPSFKELKEPQETYKPKQKEKRRNIDTDDIDELLEKTLVDLKIKVPKKQEKKEKIRIKPKKEILVEKEKAEEKKAKPQKSLSPPKIEEEKYELLEKIAVGGMAEIYKARQKGPVGFEKIITIKRILPFLSNDEEFITMFTDEARIAAQLSHPNIVQIFDLGKYKGDYIIAMEYVPGKDLGAILKKLRKIEKRMSYDIIAYIALSIAEALSYAHKKKDSNGTPLNIVHRDISPQNILISFEGEVKLTDFGISKAQNKIHQTVAGGLKGKFIYMSPEQAKGEIDIDNRADIFSFGTLLYEMIALKNPFIDRSEVAILERVKNVKYIPINEIAPDVPKELKEIIEGCLKENPQDRFAEMKDIREIIEKFIAKEGSNIIILKDKLAKFLSKLFPEEFKKEGFTLEDTKEISRREAELKRIPKEETKEKVKIAKSKEELIKLFKEELDLKDEDTKKEEKEIIKKETKQERKTTEPIKEEVTIDIEKELAGKRSSPLIFIIMAIFILGITGGGAYYYYLQQKKDYSLKYVEPKTGLKTLAPVRKADEVFRKTTKNIEGTKAQNISTYNETLKDAQTQQQTTNNQMQTVQTQQQQQQPAITQNQTAQTQQQTTQTQQQTAQTQQQTINRIESTEEQQKPVLKTGDLLPLSIVDKKPVLITKPVIRLPMKARLARIKTFRFSAMLLIDENGNVSKIRLLVKKDPYGITDSAIKKINTLKFKPAEKEGKKVKVWMPFSILIK